MLPGEQWLLDIFFPRRCLECKRVGTWLCSSCQEREPAQAELRIEQLLNGTELISFLRFQPGPVRELLHTLKYNGVWEAADTLVELIAAQVDAEAVRRVLGPDSVLLPVPISSSRRKRRGYNQAALLAGSLGKWLDLRVWEEALVRRPGRTLVGRSAVERNAQATSSFRWLGKGADRYASGNWIVVDDICTTGSTLAACAAVLQSYALGQVKALAIARE